MLSSHSVNIRDTENTAGITVPYIHSLDYTSCMKIGAMIETFLTV